MKEENAYVCTYTSLFLLFVNGRPSYDQEIEMAMSSYPVTLPETQQKNPKTYCIRKGLVPRPSGAKQEVRFCSVVLSSAEEVIGQKRMSRIGQNMNKALTR